MSTSRTLQQALQELARDEASLVHATYQYLERRPRFLGLTFLQWGQLAACACAAWLLTHVLPLPGSYDVSVAVTIAGIPAAGALVAMDADFDVWAWLRAFVRWRHTAGLYLPGLAPDSAPSGYVVRDAAARSPRPADAAGATRTAKTVEDLWR